MEEYLIIKSYNDLTRFYLFIKNYLNEEFLSRKIKYDNGKYYRIFIPRSCINETTEAISMYLIRNYVSFFIQDFFKKTNCEISYRKEYYLIDTLYSFVIKHKNPNILNFVKKDLENFSEMYSEVNIDGFTVFSFRKYKKLICSCICEKILEIQAEEEYERLITLISEYVDCTENKAEKMDIILQSNSVFICLEEENTNITEECITTVVQEFQEQTSGLEDILLSIILSYNPKECTMHLNKNYLNVNFSGTLHRLFGEKFKICEEGCELCEQFSNKNLK